MNKYFKSYINIAPFSHALWRSIEAEHISKFQLQSPLLDVGCGTGEFTKVFFQEQHTKLITGIDIDKQELVKAKKLGIYTNIIAADARNMPIEDNSFNSILSVSVLEHIVDPAKVIREMYRVLKPGGELVFTVPTSSIDTEIIPPNNFFGRFMLKMYHSLFKHEVITRKDEWVNWVKASGFEDINTIGILGKRHFKFFKLGLPSASLSQISKVILGNRGIINSSIRNKVLFNLADKATRLENFENLNILVVAKKPLKIK